MRTLTPTAAGATVEAIADLAQDGLEAQAFLEEVNERLGRVIPSDGVFFAAADPDSGLAMGAGVSTMPHEVCSAFWEHEFFVPDYTKWTDLATGPRRAADLHQATGGRPERSARWRTFKDIMNTDAELRVSFTVGGSTWGMAQLNREIGARPFSEDEVALAEQLAPIVAHGLRAGLTTGRSTPSADRGPGMAVLDREGHLLSCTREADEWFAEFETAAFRRTVGGASESPFELTALASLARVRHAAGGPAPRMRTRTVDGVWLLAHASVLTGTEEHVALVIEPAKASEIAPLIIEAYGFTPRELEVTRMIARGLKTSEMAAQLYLSPHTVRDHVKAIFEKVGVSSRGELVATMFADHYHAGLETAIEGSAVGP